MVGSTIAQAAAWPHGEFELSLSTMRLTVAVWYFATVPRSTESTAETDDLNDRC